MERAAILERLVENLPGLAYRCKHDADWTLEFASQGSTDLLGYTPDELVGRVVSIAELIHPDDLAAVSLEVERALGEHRAFQMQYRISSKDGSEKWISETGRGVLAADGSLIALEGFLTDITDHVRAQHAVFDESRKQTIVKFASGLAHDLNNMLTGLNAVIELVSRSTQPGDPLVEDLESLTLMGRSVTTLSRQLANLGRSEGAAAVWVDLGELVDSLAPVLQRLVDRPIQIDVRTQRGLVAHAEPARLEQALINLVVNARDAIEGAGRIEVSVTGLAPGIAALVVTDDGVGIDEQVQKSIFDPFFTTKAKDRGTGLGLMVVEQVATELGARIKLDSQLGKGARFELQIPIADASVPVSSTAEGMGNEVVLLVDDDAVLRTALARALRRNGYTVLESADGELALRLSERHRGPIDVLVTDGKMPKLSGPDLARAFGQQRPAACRILITGDSLPALPELFDARLQKPFTVDELAMMLRRVLLARTPQDAEGG